MSEKAAEKMEKCIAGKDSRQKRSCSKYRRFFYVFQACIIITAFSELLQCEEDAYYMPYLLVAVASFACMVSNSRTEADLSGKRNILCLIFAFVFSLMVTYANYKIWAVDCFDQAILNVAVAVVLNLILWIGTLLAFAHILLWIRNHIQSCIWGESAVSCKPLAVFFITFGIIFVINSVILYFAEYPGILSPDSINQIGQIMTGQYSNHHPVWHTFTIQLFMSLGMAMFHDINAAVAVYSFFSILFMALTFAFSIATAAEMKAPRWCILLLIAFYVLMPYHILYSFSMWKDVMYGAFILLFAVFFCRCKLNLSMRLFNIIGLAVSSLGICLYRSNGLFAFVFTAICFFIIWKRKDKKVLFIMLGVILCSLILKHPVLEAMNITQPDIVESLSVPEQQIARDLVENDDFTEDQLELLENVVSVSRVREDYVPGTADPVKNLLREKDNQAYLKEHASQFAALYFSRLLKHPFVYLKGWIDETKGYWNGGYDYWRWWKGVENNELGIESTVRSGAVYSLITTYTNTFQDTPITQVFLSIGFFVWLMILALFISIVRHDPVGIMVPVPGLMTVFSLLIATPVYAEFRYAYGIFCALPIALVIALRPDSKLQ